MSYVDAFVDRANEIVQVVERDKKGQRTFKTYPIDYSFYVKDARGKYTSIYGEPLRKVVCKNSKDLRKEIAIAGSKNVYESDLNPAFVCLSANYLGKDAPKLNVAFFDIEVDFCPTRGYSSVEDAFMPITSIAVYLQWLETLVCLAVPPKGLTMEQAEEQVKQFPNTHLFENEAEMLKVFLDIIDDADVLSGWNCIDGREFVGTTTGIKRLCNISVGETTDRNHTVTNTFNSGMKKVNVLTTVFGNTINISDEHVIPYYIKEKDKYKNLQTLKETKSENNVAFLKNLIKSNDVYVEMPIHHNNFKCMTYGDLFQNVKSLNNVVSFNETDTTIKVVSRFEHSVQKTDVIPDELLKLLGFIFTDGFFSNYDQEFSFCGKYQELIDHYASICVKYGLTKSSKIRLAKDNCYYKRFRKTSMFSLLYPLIYSNGKKEINVELLSKLSEKQFAAFVSGLIDGDGSVAPQFIEICNFEGQIKNLAALLSWNGVVCTQSKNVVRMKYLDISNHFFSQLEITHPTRKEKLKEIKTITRSNSPAKKLNWYVDTQQKTVLVKIKEIVETTDFVEMADIETTDHYFTCNGVTVHNCTAYDIPYTVNRVIKTLSKDDSRRFCLFDQFPKKREYEKYGKQSITYDLVGRVHMDYLELYRKFTYEERHSYSLDAISEYELGDKKTAYTGTLDQLYNNDFALFIEYNRQDTMLLDKLDKKLKFIDLANTYAHENTVLLPTVMGAVAAIEQAIINEAHRRGMIVCNRSRHSDDNTQAAGAYVAYPKKGLHKWIGSLDINSLYPSAIRALNMSPETIIGQLRQTETDNFISEEMAKGKSFAAAWEGKFGSIEYEYVINQKIGNDVTIDWENGSSDTLSGAQAYQLIFESNQHWTISANGTIFTYEKEGLIPGLLKKWYADRKEMQKTLKNFIDLKYGIELPDRFKS